MNTTDIKALLKKYTPVLSWSEEDQLWLASYPDLLGPCTHASGETEADALAELQEIAIYHIEDELADYPDGSTITPPSTIVTTPTPSRYTDNPASVEAIRHHYGLSQKDFAGILGISLSTYSKWANTDRKPSGAAARLLQVAEHYPEALGIPSRRKKAAVMA